MKRHFPSIRDSTLEYIEEVRKITKQVNSMDISSFKQRAIFTDMMVRVLSCPPPNVEVGETVLKEFMSMENIDIHAKSKASFGEPRDIFDELLRSGSFEICQDIIMGRTQYIPTEKQVKALFARGYWATPRPLFSRFIVEIINSKWGFIEKLHNIIPDDMPISAQLIIYGIRINGHIGRRRYANVIPTLKIMLTMLCCESRVGKKSKLRLLHTDIFRLIYTMLN